MEVLEPKENSSIVLSNSAHYGTEKRLSSKEAPPDTELDDIAAGETQENKAVADDKEKSPKRREEYDNVFQFVLSLVGYAVGLGNIWRFSYLCAKNGGSAFIIPYLTMLVVLGIPLFYMELSLGQAVKKGPLRAWYTISPNLGGIGVSALIVNSFVCIYYNVIIAWVFFYLFNSFYKTLPWGVCLGYDVIGLSDKNKLDILKNITGNRALDMGRCFNSSTRFFWYHTALGASDDIEFVESFNWKMFLCLLLAWVTIYFCLFRGIQSSGKVIYFTAIFPYIVLVCLFFRAVTLPGASDGLIFLLRPSKGFLSSTEEPPGTTVKTRKTSFMTAVLTSLFLFFFGLLHPQAIHHFFSPQVWLEAATQIFFSLGLSVGALVALASYSEPRYNNLANSVIVCCINSFTSIFCSIIVFSIVGYRARLTKTDPSIVAQGPGLTFIVFTEAILHMPGSPFWAILFFVMLLTLGMDSQFASVESIITIFYDTKVVKMMRKEIFVAILCFVFFVVSIPFALGNGIYLFQLFDQFATTIPLLFVGFFEFIAVGWVCGVNRFFTEFTKPYHKNLVLLWTIMWKWVDPIIMIIIFAASVLLQIIHPLTYVVNQKEPVYPPWAMFLGVVIILSSVLMIPTVIVVRLISYQSARDEAKEFLLRVYHSGKNAAGLTWRHIRRGRGEHQLLNQTE